MIEGKQVIAVDPKNTSQQCSECGEIVKKTLAERWHKCPKCGLELDRDHNASINIMNRGLSVSDRVKKPIERQADEAGQYLMFT
jgi:transposase